MRPSRLGRSIIVFCTPLLFAATRLEAQSLAEWQAGAGGLVGLPQGSLQDSLGERAYGGMFHIAHRVKGGPFWLGLNIGGADYETLQLPVDPPRVASTSASINFIHALVRAQRKTGGLRPYADVLVGVSRPNATTILSEPASPIPVVSFEEEFANTVFSYGVGAGVMVPFINRSHKSRGLRAVSLDLQARYIAGSNAEYVRPGSLRFEQGRVAFDTFHAGHELVNLEFGFAFDF